MRFKFQFFCALRKNLPPRDLDIEFLTIHLRTHLCAEVFCLNGFVGRLAEWSEARVARFIL